MCDSCDQVDNAVVVRLVSDYAVIMSYYFCPKVYCVKTPPVWTNIRSAGNVESITKGENISEAAHNILVADLKK